MGHSEASSGNIASFTTQTHNILKVNMPWRDHNHFILELDVCGCCFQNTYAHSSRIYRKVGSYFFIVPPRYQAKVYSKIKATRSP